MKVFLVDIDNGETYEDYRHEVKKAFSTFRAASQWLVNEGYEPYPHNDNVKNELKIGFWWYESDEYMADTSYAKIIEMTVEEKEEHRELTELRVTNRKLIDSLQEIDTHIRSTREPLPYIIETLKQTLPEYQMSHKLSEEEMTAILRIPPDKLTIVERGEES
ncbi:hypothetical protein [Bacillus infantis]|uniref:hypothetical protein n=1 Tax=Bacillus infantis TaxID=324767 RepID=UPI003CE98DA4